ncbi:MAG TPA: GNAT family N-acetyltransferase [Steroidobacteraceae bacterium]|nr:GNAT family N-acetyltransferase [Steroidobacteraceae bacterium]
MQVRTAQLDEVDAIAKVWYDAWQDGHASVVPAELARDRSEESFRSRLHAMLPDTRVIGPRGAPLGFCSIKGDELYQLFVSAAARGTGAATSLLADGEARLAVNGVRVAWLACAIGNDRAARFYEKCGWHRAGVFTSHLETANGTFDLDVWRYEKALNRTT